MIKYLFYHDSSSTKNIGTYMGIIIKENANYHLRNKKLKDSIIMKILFILLSIAISLSCTNKQQILSPITPCKELNTTCKTNTTKCIKSSIKTTKRKISLKEHGILLTQQMGKLANDQEYIKICSHAKDVNNIVANIAKHKYDVPKKIFSINQISFKSVDNSLIIDKLLRSIPLKINSLNGSTLLAATSLLVTEDAFFYKMRPQEPVIYLYLYEGDWHSMVIFRPVRDNIVQAYSYFVHHKMLNESKEKDDIKSFYSKILKIEGVNIIEYK